MKKPFANLSHPDTYYSATINSTKLHDELSTDIDVETCVVGGGYAGIMTQLGLLQRGQKRVALIEQNRIAWGASGRNGGFVFSGYSLSPQKLCEQVGIERAKSLYQFTTDAVGLIRQRIVDYDISCDVVDEGVLWANWFRSQRVLLDTQTFMQDKMGAHWEYISPDKLVNFVNSKRYHGALFEPNALHFHPLNYALGIVDESMRLGGQLYENTCVLGVENKDQTITVTTNNGRVRCENLVICGGGYIGNLFPSVSRAILPIATYIVVTEPLSPNYRDNLFTNAAVYDSRFAFDYYRPLQDGRLLWGGRISANIHRSHNVEMMLRKDISKVFPSLKDVRIDYAWDGLMAYAKHQMPCIGRLERGVWYNIGFGGHGVAPTTAAGELIAAAITEGDERYEWFSPWGLPWNGGRLGPFAAQSSYWWYQFKDLLKEKLGHYLVAH